MLAIFTGIEDFLFSTLIGALLISVISLILIVLKFNQITQKNDISQQVKLETNFFFLLIFATIEELISRALLIGFLQQFIPLFIAFTLSIFIFTILHFYNGKMTLVSILNLVIISIVFGIIYLKFGLWTVIGVHYGWNLSQWTILGYPYYGKQVGRYFSIHPRSPEWLSGGQYGPEYSIVTSIFITLIGTLLFLRV